MKKHWKLLKTHLYLGIGSLIAITALVLALTFGLSSAQAQGGQSAGCKENQLFYPDAKACMTLEVYRDWKAKK
ncbi:MAG: hypothetical protein UY05_C0026G0005 [Candidatus Peregrinibacteria bacterium GW2011_GWA2_47_7]|nr:MAG: hypothetical protein UY05_C0026G0005 [Candidatus Peregrinibacteria bacterium GW2011_GWA2_47_7]HAZ01440.1 hypothetical protein [Marinilabiliales bacterium]